MELRVVVIAVISLIIVSMSLIMQGQSQRGLQTPGAEVNLLDPPVSQIKNVNGADFSGPLGAGSSTDSWNAPGELMESESEPLYELDTTGESESLEPDLPTNRKMWMPTETSNMIPQLTTPETSANAGTELAVSTAEALLVPEAALEPLETEWQSSESGDFATASNPPLPPLGVAESTDQLQAEAPSGVAFDSATAPLAVAPAVDVAAEQLEGTPFESNPPLQQKSIQDIPTSVAQIARNHLQYGNSLARRGSLFSARQEFFSGLRLIIESLDLVNGVATHREHYALAIVALNEAEDFVDSAGDDISNSVPRIVELHQSKILNSQELHSLTPMAAMQAYFAFSQNHFSAACEHSSIASELLFSLGKLHSVKATQSPSGQPTDVAIAILMHQAALNVDPNNYLSANELGVALARLRYYEPARAALLHSLATQATPEAWLNLSIVHRALGETQLAELALAEKKAAEAARGNQTQVAQKIRWIAPNEFASAQQVHYEYGASHSSKTANAATENPITQTPATGGGIWASLKRSFGTK